MRPILDSSSKTVEMPFGAVRRAVTTPWNSSQVCWHVGFPALPFSRSRFGQPAPGADVDYSVCRLAPRC
ncbi:hypothetical protein Nepgr_027250 [Nepenthes gracilis]|uniref:Uncharacterized protein n=1 Tax=Nepenthes gracilis TaxID=150966 RepID=A0AAD3Y129_NEPGR|nr:hypothetical protein Nepgr_027250 [Nepenthes gracilis]